MYNFRYDINKIELINIMLKVWNFKKMEFFNFIIMNVLDLIKYYVYDVKKCIIICIGCLIFWFMIYVKNYNIIYIKCFK